jgi:LacI family transcriptional regulator
MTNFLLLSNQHDSLYTMKSREKVTMKQIADRVGVSVNSVSKALNNKSDISPTTREEIARVAEELGYSLRQPEKASVQKDTGIIGLVTTDSANPFFSKIVKGVQTTLRNAGYTMMLFNTDEDYIQERTAIELLMRQGAQGIILTPTQRRAEDLDYLKNKKIPFVLLGRHFSGHNIPSVISNDTQGAYDAVNHLLRLGHKRILFLNAPSYISSAEERLKGYVRAHEELGVPIDDSLIRRCLPDKDSAYNEMNAVFLEEENFSAIFTFSDIMMLGVVKLLQEQSISIPDTYSLVGFDDIDFVSLLNPSLTTVAQDREALGIQSAELLLKIMRNEHIVQYERVIPTRLVIRTSTQRLS